MPKSLYQLEIRLSDVQALRVDLPITGGLVGSDPSCAIHIDDARIPARWIEIHLVGQVVNLRPLENGSEQETTVPIGHWCVLPAGHLRVVPAPRTTYQTVVLNRRVEDFLEQTTGVGWDDVFLELVGDDEATTTRFPLSVGQTITIGRRKSKCDVALSDTNDQISRHHATVQWRGGTPVLRDHSTNGTFWRRPGKSESFRGVAGPQPLRHGDLIQIGPWTLRFHWPEAAMADRLYRSHATGRVPTASPAQAGSGIDWLVWTAGILAILCGMGILWLVFLV